MGVMNCAELLHLRNGMLNVLVRMENSSMHFAVVLLSFLDVGK